MAITELLSIRAKKGIAFFGDAPSGGDRLAFEERGFSVLSSCTVDELQDALRVLSRVLAGVSVSEEELQEASYLAGLFAVVFTQRAEKPLQFVPGFEENVKRLLDNDCDVVVRNAPFGRSIVINVIERLKLPSMGLTEDEEERVGEWRSTSGGDIRPPHVRIFDSGVTWRDTAQAIASYPPGTAPNLGLKVNAEDTKGKRIRFSEGRDLLIRRAFSNCTELDLVEMPGGLSGGQVYRAYPKLAANDLGPEFPLPCFVKIGQRNEIFDEYRNYEGRVHGNIPFHLRPHLDLERCCLGSGEGIIVGDYVEESESLRDCASDGRAVPAIACLFTRTLQGWYRHAEQAKQGASWEETHLFDLFPESIPNRRARCAKTGATKSLAELRALFSRCESMPVLSGPTHGDLHATNVLVRATDAIVIDFAKHCRKPLVYDAASLEAGLLVEGFDNDKRDLSVWLDSIRPLYHNLQLQGALPRVHPNDPSTWFYASVRQIRLYAREMECREGQYAAALAIALLKKSSKDLKFDRVKEGRRAAAYVLAERVLLSTFEPEQADYSI